MSFKIKIDFDIKINITLCRVLCKHHVQETMRNVIISAAVDNHLSKSEAVYL